MDRRACYSPQGHKESDTTEQPSHTDVNTRWENGIETCIISYVKQIASPGSTHDTGCSGLVHWDDPEGWYGEGERGMIWEDGIETCILSYAK